MSILSKNTETPRKTQKNNNLLKTSRIPSTVSKCQLKGAQFFKLARGAAGPLSPPSVMQLALAIFLNSEPFNETNLKHFLSDET